MWEDVLLPDDEVSMTGTELGKLGCGGDPKEGT